VKGYVKFDSPLRITRMQFHLLVDLEQLQCLTLLLGL
jgi:hypothetical protein